MPEWLAGVLILFGGAGGSMIIWLLRRPVIRAELNTARWFYRFRDGSEKTAVDVVVTVYLTNRGNVGTDVVGSFIVNGTCFTKSKPISSPEVSRVAENTTRQLARFHAAVPISAIEDAGDGMVVSGKVRLTPEGHQRIGLIGGKHIDITYNARFRQLLEDVL